VFVDRGEPPPEKKQGMRTNSLILQVRLGLIDLAEHAAPALDPVN